MRKLAITITTIVALGLTAAPAAADHTHVIRHKDGSCTILAANGGEKNVVLPGYDHLPENRRHPLHVKVHLGKPGERGNIGVLGVVDCDSYRN